MIAIRCALCGGEQRIKILFKSNLSARKISHRLFSARRVPDNIHYQINKCLKCGLFFSSPILPLGKIAQFYKKSKFTYQQESVFLAETYFKYLKLFMYDPLAKILDIGCGDGFFLRKLYTLGFKNLYGIEPSRQAFLMVPPFLKKKVKNDFFKKNYFHSTHFDVVTCFHTLDHVSDPNSFLKNVNKILKRKGAAYFIVHNTEGLSVRLLGEKSPIFDIEHIYLFNKDNLKKIFHKNGFGKTKVFDVKNTYPLFYWIKMSPLPVKVKIFIEKFVEFSGLGRLPVSLKAGNIGIIAHKN